MQDNVIRFMNVEKPGPKVRARGAGAPTHVCLTQHHLPASMQELSVSLVDNALKQLKQLKQQA